METFDRYVDDHQTEYLAWFTEYLTKPALAARNEGVEEAASATVDLLQSVGFTTEVWRREGAAPVVFGEIGDGPVTLLIYDHYDVQPAEPLDLWSSPPFAADIRDGKLYARGSSDNRGEIVARLAAIDAWRKTIGPLPIRIKFLIEGEEEIGSPNLPAHVRDHQDRLAADGILWEGGGWDETEGLQFALGCKGLAYVELHVAGPGYDLHSANASIVDNPAWRLLQALNTLRDAEGRVLVDGYDDVVVAATADDDRALESLPMDLEKIKKVLQVDKFLETDVAALKRRYVFGPTVNICGIESGYTGEGPKTIVPSRAWCKLDFRLVPNLTTDNVLDMLRQHLDRRGFNDVEVRYIAGVNPSRSSSDSRLARASLAAANALFGDKAYLVPMFAGSGPCHLFADELGLPLVSAGAVAYEESRAHAPNENVRLADWYAGIHFIGHLIKAFSL